MPKITGYISISLNLREEIGFASQLSEKSLPLIINLPDGASLVDHRVLSLVWECRGHRFNPWSEKIPHAAEQLRPWASTIGPVLLSPGATVREQSPLTATRERPTQQRRPSGAKKQKQKQKQDRLVSTQRAGARLAITKMLSRATDFISWFPRS